MFFLDEMCDLFCRKGYIFFECVKLVIVFLFFVLFREVTLFVGVELGLYVFFCISSLLIFEVLEWDGVEGLRGRVIWE